MSDSLAPRYHVRGIKALLMELEQQHQLSMRAAQQIDTIMLALDDLETTLAEEE